jgi:hypothetical protein
MTKTYSEMRQLAYFRAAREMYRIAEMTLLDTLADEVLTERSMNWARDTAGRNYDKAYALETTGHEECIASNRSEKALRNARSAVTAADYLLKERGRKLGFASAGAPLKSKAMGTGA